MDRRRLKTVMILILALVNVFLLFHLSGQLRVERSARRRTQERLTALFASDGVSLSPKAFSREALPEAVSLSWDGRLETEVAALFLGRAYRFEEEAGLRRYRSGNAVAEFHSGGVFTVTGLAIPGEEKIQTFCQTYAYDRADDSGTAAEAVGAEKEVSVTARYGEYPVFNCRVSFRFTDGGILREVSGTLLSRNTSPLTETTEALSASGALSLFQSTHRKNRVAVSAISGLSVCYWLDDGDSGEMELLPAWRVETDTVAYYINCFTGGISVP